jgi:hypothetical protein
VNAQNLGFTHVGGFLRWRIEDPEALLEQWTPLRELAWIGFDGSIVQVGLWPRPEQVEHESFEEFALQATTPVEVFAVPDEDPAELLAPYTQEMPVETPVVA